MTRQSALIAFLLCVASSVGLAQDEVDEPSEVSTEEALPEEAFPDEAPAVESLAGSEPADVMEEAAAEPLTVVPAEVPPSTTRRLIFVDPGRESLHEMLQLQLPDWHVRQVHAPPSFLTVDQAQRQLMPEDAVVWIERSGDIDRVALLSGVGDTPITSPLPAEDVDDASRAFALVVEGLIREQAWTLREETSPSPEICESDEREIEFDWGSRTYYEASPSRRSLWPSPLARDGWLFRFGWTHAGVPRQDTFFGGGTYQYLQLTGGARIALGRWIHPLVRLSLFGEFTWALEEPEGALGLQAMVVSKTRFRMGAGFDIAGLIVSEQDRQTGNRYGWVGYRIGIPMELGLEVNGRGGFMVQVGPTFTKAPYASIYVGYQMSVEWEFN